MNKKKLFRQQKNSSTSNLPVLATVSTLGIHLVVSTAVGTAIGYFLDKWLHTGPWLMMAFFVIGIIAGFREIFRQVNKLNDSKN